MIPWWHFVEKVGEIFGLSWDKEEIYQLFTNFWNRSCYTYV